MTTATTSLTPGASSAHPRPSRARLERTISIVLAVLVAIGGVVAFVRWRTSHAVNPVRYETVRVDRGPIAAKVTATGSLSALVTVNVGAQVSGRIEKLNVDFASAVSKGQVIARIEPSLFKAAVTQARASYAATLASVEKARAQEIQAEREYARSKGLLAENLASRADFEAAEANLGVAHAQVAAMRASVDEAKAALGQAELSLSYCTVRSPIDGVVISRNVDVGQTVAATLQAPTLFSIAQDLGRMQVDTNVAEADVGRARAGMNVTFTVDAYPGRTFAGVVRQVRDNAQTIQNVVTYDAVIDVDNADHALKPSMTANVTFVYATRSDALRIPNAALRFKPDAATLNAMMGPSSRSVTAEAKPDERVVWVLRDGRAVPTTIRIGIGGGESTEALGDFLREGDLVVTEANVDPSAKGRSS